MCNAVGDFVPFRFSLPFGGIQMTQVNVVETEIKPLTCKTSDTEYVSEGIDKKNIGRSCPGPSKELVPQIPNWHTATAKGQ